MKRSRSSDNKIEFYHLLFQRSQVRSISVRSDDIKSGSIVLYSDLYSRTLCPLCSRKVKSFPCNRKRYDTPVRSRAKTIALQETYSEMRCYAIEHLLLCDRASAVMRSSICCYAIEHLLLCDRASAVMRSRAGTLALQETYYYSDACGNNIYCGKERNIPKKRCVNKRVTHPKTNIENVLSLPSGTYC